MKRLVILLAAFAMMISAKAQTICDEGYRFIENLSYVSENEKDAYRKERCVLDLYYPETDKGFATLVWFHGGGLESGRKEILSGFRRQGLAVVGVNYRLSPKAQCPSYIDDAAQALAWTFENIEKYGGDPAQIYVAGHSAGGYLTLMLVLAKKYTEQFGLDADRIAKAYPVSGQTATHYTIRKERGLDSRIPVVDSLAPLANVRKEAAPMVLISGDRELEMMARYEENIYLYSLLKAAGHDSVLYEMQGFDHVSVLEPAVSIIRTDIKRLWKEYLKTR